MEEQFKLKDRNVSVDGHLCTNRRCARNTECAWTNRIEKGTHKQRFETDRLENMNSLLKLTPTVQLRADSSVEH